MSDNETTPPGIRRRYRKQIAIAVEAAVSVILTVYGAYGVLNDDLVVPVIHSLTGSYFKSAHTTENLHFHGAAAQLLFAAFLCLAAGFAVLIVRQLETKPGRKTDAGPANGLVGMGFAVIVAMVVLKWLGVV